MAGHQLMILLPLIPPPVQLGFDEHVHKLVSVREEEVDMILTTQM